MVRLRAREVEENKEGMEKGMLRGEGLISGARKKAGLQEMCSKYILLSVPLSLWIAEENKKFV